MKQIGKTYDPLGGLKPSVVEGKFKLTMSDIFERNEAAKDGTKCLTDDGSKDQFNSDYQNYKKDLNEHFKQPGSGYEGKIDEFTDSKAAGLNKLINGDKKKEVDNQKDLPQK